jgi:hypothetical protein
MRANDILELIIYAAVIAYFVNMQRKLIGRSPAALEFQQRLAERKKAGEYVPSKEAFKKLNWLGISAGVLLCAITAYHAFK